MKLSLTKYHLDYTIKIFMVVGLLGAGIALGLWGSTFLKTVPSKPMPSCSQQVVKADTNLKNRNMPDAFKDYVRALSLLPDIHHILCGLAHISTYAHHYDLTVAFLTVAQTIDRNNPALLIALAQAHSKLEEPAKAEKCLRSLSLLPQLSFEHTLQASKSFAELGLLQEALTFAKKAATLQPRNPIALANVGNMHNRLGALDTAIDYYKKALAINPTIPNIIYNLGYTLKRQGKLKESLIYFDKAIALKPGYLDALIDRAYTYWALGDFDHAWHDYAWRFKMHGADPTTTLPVPLWDGRDLRGKTILLYAEQGFGDTLQFIRLAENVKKRGNPKIICKVQKPLIKLLQSYPYVDKLVTTYETKGVDYQAPLMSLPGILKLSPSTIPAPKSYLHADATLVAQWQKKLIALTPELCPDKSRTAELRVGLCWHVDPIHEKDKSPVSRRSVELKDVLPLGALPHITFYALQQGKGLEEINSLPESFNLIAFDPYFDKRHGSFMDSAAVIANLDLVITVDTAIAHLAGALGKEVWIFLPFSPDGRWSHTTNKTPWYPTATLFRQITPSNWKAPINEMQKLLQQRIAEKRKPLT